VTPKEILEKWDAAVAVGKARRRALMDASINPEEYCALSVAQTMVENEAVAALGGFIRYTLPSLTAWPGAR